MRVGVGIGVNYPAAHLGSASGSSPPPGYFFLKGKNGDGSYTVLRGQVSAGVYVNLSGK